MTIDVQEPGEPSADAIPRYWLDTENGEVYLVSPVEGAMDPRHQKWQGLCLDGGIYGELSSKSAMKEMLEGDETMRPLPPGTVITITL